MDFLLVYISEAHPSDGQQAPQNERDKVVYKTPKTLAERQAIAKDCLQSMKLTMPCVLDNMQNTTENAYQGWPDRICIVDVDGKVGYYSGPGPGGFKPRDAETALKAVLDNGGKFVPPAAAEGK